MTGVAPECPSSPNLGTGISWYFCLTVSDRLTPLRQLGLPSRSVSCRSTRAQTGSTSVTTGALHHTLREGAMPPKKTSSALDSKVVESILLHTDPNWDSSPIRMPGWFALLLKDIPKHNAAFDAGSPACLL